MEIVIAGGSGFVGRRLIEKLLAGGASQVTVLTRDPVRTRAVVPGVVNCIAWDPRTSPPPAEILENVDAVVNLTGENVASGRWTQARKLELVESRIFSTRNLVKGMETLTAKPKVFISASAIGYYGPRDDSELTEDATPGEGFLSDLSKDWETEAFRAREFGVRTVCLRVGIVLGLGGGALQKMLFPFKMGAGGPLGSGRQWMSWIHIDDLVGIILHAIKNDAVSGPVNGTAPEPVTNRDFSRALGRALHRPAFIPMPGFALKLLVGEFGQILLEGQRVVPRAALDAGYEFEFRRVDEALEDLLT